MKTRVSIIIMSHLSDAQVLVGTTDRKLQTTQYNHINFAKFLLMKYRDQSTEIDPDVEWALYCEKYPNTK